MWRPGAIASNVQILREPGAHQRRGSRPQGRPVGALTAADFEVFDKGERRRILDFQVDRTSPLSLALLVDASGSMVMGPRLPFARRWSST